MSYAIQPAYTRDGIFLSGLGASVTDPYYEMRYVGPYAYRAVKVTQLPIVTAHLAKYRVTKEGEYRNVPGEPGFEVLYGAEANPSGTGEPILQWALDKAAGGEGIVIGTNDDFVRGDDIVLARIPRNMLPQLSVATKTGGAILYEPKDGWVLPTEPPKPGGPGAPIVKKGAAMPMTRVAGYAALGLGAVAAAVLLLGGRK